MRPQWPPNHIQWPFSRPVVEMRGLSTEEAASYSHKVALDCKLTLCLWRRQCGGIRSAVGGQIQGSRKSGVTEESQGGKEQTQRRQASTGLLEAYFAAHHCAMQ